MTSCPLSASVIKYCFAAGLCSLTLPAPWYAGVFGTAPKSQDLSQKSRKEKPHARLRRFAMRRREKNRLVDSNCQPFNGF
jgi:hypothetical protein